MSALVSIIIPCYNSEKFIVNTINSVKNQSYENFECIIINDGSSDNTKNVVLKQIESDTRFHFFSQTNQGLSATRNRGINLSNGEYIYFLDSDDLLDKKSLHFLLQLASEEVDIVFGKTAITEGQNTTVKNFLQHQPKTNTVYHNEAKSLIPLVINSPLICIACNRLYKSSFLKNNSILFEENLLHEDELWHFETLFHAKAIILSGKTTYYYNTKNANSISNNFTLKNTESYLKISELLYHKYYLNENFQDFKDIISTYITYIQIITISHCYNLTPENIKQKSEALITENFKLIKTKKTQPTLNKKNEALHNLFKKVMHLKPNTILTFINYQRSKSLKKWVKKNYMLMRLNLTNN